MALSEARSLRDHARSVVLSAAGYDKAVAAARKADEMARAGGASAKMRQEVEEWLDKVKQEADAAAKDRQLLAALLEVRGPREGPKYRRDEKGMIVRLALPMMEEQFASAFRDWGLNVDAVPIAEAAARLKERPPAVVTEVIAALDEWASQRRQDRKPEAAGRVAELVTALDDDPGSRRRELREIMARGRLHVERALGALSAALRPVPVPVEVPLGEDRARLRQLAEEIDPSSEPVLGLLTLTRALEAAGEEALAERLLRAALTARPHEVVLYHTLGQLLTRQKPPRWAEAVECYVAARALRPELGVALAQALRRSGRERESRGLFAQLVKERPYNPYLHFLQGDFLHAKGDVDGAIACLHKAIKLDPKYALAHLYLGHALRDKRDLGGAIACYQKAIKFAPKNAFAYANLGIALAKQGKPVEACKRGVCTTVNRRSIVSGRSKPASDGRLKTSHFEETQNRQVALRVPSVLHEAYHVEPAQSGHDRNHLVAPSTRLVAATHRTRTRQRPRDCRPLSAARSAASKTSHCAHRPCQPGRPCKTSHCAPRLEQRRSPDQENALKGRRFASLEEENQFLLDWERSIADTRIHGTTRRPVGTHFVTVERPALQRLPLERFPCFHEARRVVHRDGQVEVERAYYSVPREYLARGVWARWDGRLVRIFNDKLEQIAVHVRHEPGRFSTQSQHICGPKISGVERGASWLLGQVRRLGPCSLRWAEALLQARGVEGVRVLQGLLNLAHRHPCAAIERACDIALSHGAFRLRTLRQLLDRAAPRQEQLPFLDEHTLIRPLSDYQQFVHDTFQKESAP